jgi:putative spermidine/putrescine transport system substrate-binding protein
MAAGVWHATPREKRLHPVHAAAKMALDDALRDRRLVPGGLSRSARLLRRIGPRPSSQGGAHVARHKEEDHLTTTRRLSSLLTAGATLVLVAACSSPGSSGAAGSGGTGGVDWTPNADLLTAAKAEGTLNTIALPRDWCNYGELLDTFKTKTGLALNEITPNAGSAQEIDAIKNNPNGGPAAPDVIDVGYSFGPSAKDEGLLQAYKVATWDTIKSDAKDPDGFWYGDYYGVLSFEINKDIIKGESPKDWKDLLKPEFKNSVAMAGDPLNSNQAIQTVQAAALANGGTLDNAQPGLDFFKQLNDAGNFVPTVAKQGTLVSGETPIVITWSYLALADRDSLAGTVNVEVVVPASGKFGGVYVQGISKTAPHPNAAKLWEEYLYSDAGQLVWTGAYCYTTRYEDLSARNVIPADMKAKLPDVSGTVFPTLAQNTAAATLVKDQWASVTGVGPLKTVAPAP